MNTTTSSWSSSASSWSSSPSLPPWWPIASLQPILHHHALGCHHQLVPNTATSAISITSIRITVTIQYQQQQPIQFTPTLLTIMTMMEMKKKKEKDEGNLEIVHFRFHLRLVNATPVSCKENKHQRQNTLLWWASTKVSNLDPHANAPEAFAPIKVQQ